MEQTNEENRRKKAKDSTKTFSRLFGYTWTHKGYFIVANISLVMSALGTIYLPLICGQMVDVIKDGGDLNEMAIRFAFLTVFMAVFTSTKMYMFDILG